MIHKKFFEGRAVPDIIPGSIMEIEWWDEQVYYCKNGRTIDGTYITGDFYWWLNFTKIKQVDRLKNSIFTFPLYCSTDEWIFKQLEEARKSDLNAMLLSSAGVGKSYGAASLVAKNYTLYPRSQSIISSSRDPFADNLMGFVEDILDGLPKQLAHPKLSNYKRQYMLSGSKNPDNTIRDNSFRSEIEKILFGDDSGAVRGKRPEIHIWEEIGNWTGSAGLISCYNAAKGRYLREGSNKTGFAYMIGTGGQVKAEAAKELYDMAHNPDAFGLYSVDPPEAQVRKIIFVPCHHKMAGFYEKEGPVLDKQGNQIGYVREEGVPDIEGAKKYKEAVREKAKGSPQAYASETREFPFEIGEIFQTDSPNPFNKIKLGYAKQQILEFGKAANHKRGRFFPIDVTDLSKGVLFKEMQNGAVLLMEEVDTYLNEFGVKVPYKKLYTMGIDGIDIGDSETSESYKGRGSKFAFTIKKGVNPDARLGSTSRKYVCRYLKRSDNIKEDYEQAMLASIYFDAKINIEFSKKGFIDFMKNMRQQARLMPRPSITTGGGPESKLLGTTAHITNIDLGIEFISIYIEENYTSMEDLEMIDELLIFDYNNRKKFDLTMSLVQTEIGYTETGEIGKKDTSVTSNVRIGNYRDASGKMRFGTFDPKSIADNRKTFR